MDAELKQGENVVYDIILERHKCEDIQNQYKDNIRTRLKEERILYELKMGRRIKKYYGIMTTSLEKVYLQKCIYEVV